jgi:hypothetical protein
MDNVELHIVEKGSSLLNPIKPGTPIEYNDKGNWISAELITLHADGEDPYYSIKIADGPESFRERQTIRGKIRVKERRVRFDENINIREYVPETWQPSPPQPPQRTPVPQRNQPNTRMSMPGMGRAFVSTGIPTSMNARMPGRCMAFTYNK